jgi:hypothetical protein
VASKRSSVVPAPCAAACRASGRGLPPGQARCPCPTCTAPPLSLLFVGPAGSRSARWPSLPQSPLCSPLQPFKVALMRGLVRRGSARLACARPAFGCRSLPHAPCSRPTSRDHGPRPPHSAVTPPPKTSDVRSLVDRSAQPRTCTTRPAARRCRPRRASSRRTGKGSRRRSSGRPRGAGRSLCHPGLRAGASRPQALRRPPYRAHWPVSGR